MCRIGKLMNKIANICYFELSEIRTPRFNGHFVQVQNAFPLTALHYNKIQTAHYFINQTAFLVPGLYKTWWIMQMLACLSGKVVHHHWSTGHYNTTGTHSTCLWLALLTSIYPCPQTCSKNWRKGPGIYCL